MNFPIHGADPVGLYQAFDIEMPDKIIDFSTNTNGLPYTKELDIDFYALMSHYPMEECKSLISTISRVNMCSEDEVILCNGSNEIIYLIASIYSGKNVAIYSPTYGEYERAVNCYDAKVFHIFDLIEITDDVDLVFICNPNNPTGSYIQNADIVALAREYPATLFVIDEAYRDFMAYIDEPISDYDNIILLRSLTKIYHLSGLRIGYSISNPNFIEQLKSRQPSWSVNAPAAYIGEIYLNDPEYLANTKLFYQLERYRVLSAIRDMGYTVCNTTANYFLLQTDDDEKLIRFMLENGIVIRHTRNFKGLDGGFVRIAIKDKASNDILLSTLSKFMEANNE